MRRSDRIGRSVVGALLGASLAAVFVSNAAAAPFATAADDVRAVELLDEALDALDRDDVDVYSSLQSAAERGDVWLPDLAVEALDDRDTDVLVDFTNLLGLENTDIVAAARVALEVERNDLAVIGDDEIGTAEQQVALRSSDLVGHAVLQTLLHRGVEVPAAAHALLETLPESVRRPDVAAYELALSQLGELAGAAATTGDVGGFEANPSGASPSRFPLLVPLAFGAVALGIVTMRRRRTGGRLAGVEYTDGLTGLKNRRRMDADIAVHVAAGKRTTATLMVDVDHFRRFNDTHGHALGDEVLRLVGETLDRQFRSTDVAYRYGGEEFCVLLNDATARDATDAAERVRLAIEAIELPVAERITASVGVSIGPASGLPATIELADGALDAAKQAGRNRVAVAGLVPA